MKKFSRKMQKTKNNLMQHSVVKDIEKFLDRYKISLLEIVILIFSLIYILIFWIHLMPTNPQNAAFTAPDEPMRYQIAHCIYVNHQLPSASDTCAKAGYGWSYAFYPQMLGSIVSAVFMWIFSVFHGANASSLIIYARLASVLFGIISMWFIGRTTSVFFAENPRRKYLSAFAMLFFIMIPQISFLSSYVNNDIVGLCGTSILVYACVKFFKTGWNYKNAIWLSVGFIISILGYLFAYGFVGAAIFFIIALGIYKVLERSLTFTKFIKVGLFTFAIVAIATLPFFIRNGFLYHGDILGMSAFQKSQSIFVKMHKIAIPQKPYHGGLVKLLMGEGQNWVLSTIESSIGVMGAMAISITSLFILYYFIIFSFIGSSFSYLREIFAKLSFKKYNVEIIGVGSLILGILFTIALDIYYTLRVDYQAQGRYIIYIWIPVILMMTLGVSRIKFKKNWPYIVIISCFIILNLLAVNITVNAMLLNII